jgi:hypothetical protein
VSRRTLLIHGARRVLQLSGTRTDAKSRWAEQLKLRRGNNIAAVALAAKHAPHIFLDDNEHSGLKKVNLMHSCRD